MGRVNHALIMAAGRGRRMMPLTDLVPKPMAPYLDSTLIGNGIGVIRKHIPNIHVTVGYKGAMLAQHLIEIGVSSVLNTDGRTNSWWLYNTLLRLLDEPLFVLTCDNITDIDFSSLERDYEAQGRPACMIVPVTPVAGLDGDYIFAEGNVVSEISRTKPSPIYCSGIQVLNPYVVNALTREQGDFYAVWQQLIVRKQLRVSSVKPTKWFTVDTIEDLQRVAAMEG